MVMRKLAIGCIAAPLYRPFAGTIYGSAADTITELAKTVVGGYAKVCHTPLFANAAAMVDRSAVIATAMFIQSSMLETCKGIKAP